MMEFHTVEGSRHMSEEQSPPGYRTSCARAGPSPGFLSKINAKIGIQLETTIHRINVHLKQHATFSWKRFLYKAEQEESLPYFSC